jgi:hypothetical protein
MRRNLLLASCVALATLISAKAPVAQTIAPSQLGKVSQTIAGTQVDITYRRPVARGRELFGNLVPWGVVWTPSADTSATFQISGPTEVNGTLLEAGSYGIWAIPDANTWTIIFSREPAAFHRRYPEGQDVLRVQANSRTGEHVETLQFEFPLVDADSALLQMRWGTTVVPLKLRARAIGN